MPTAITDYQQYTMTPSYSTTTTMKSYHPTNNNSNKSATATILKATVISFEKRASDQKIWYTIRVEPLGQKKYLISRKYEDFSQFSQKLHERFNTNQYRTGSRLPPKIKSRALNLLPTSKQIHAQRVQELNSFLSVLFQRQSIVTDSFTVLEFFGASGSGGGGGGSGGGIKQQKSSTRPDVNSEKSNNYLFIKNEQQQYAAMEEDSTMMVVDENSSIQQQQQQQQQESNNNTIQSRWKRLRCTSFLANKSPQPVPSTSTSNGLSLLCSQAANKIMPSTWHRINSSSASVSPQSSISTPASKSSLSTKVMTIQQQQQQQRKQVLKKSKSTLGIYSSKMQLHPLDAIPPTPTTPTTTITYNHHQHQIKSTIKIKVIYDVDNIVVIQVPRSISLDDLRSRIIQKFSDPASAAAIQLVDKLQDLVLLFHDNSSSCCSIATSSSSSTSTTSSSEAVQQPKMVLPAVLINKEQDLNQIMNTKWNRLEKVTLRCIM